MKKILSFILCLAMIASFVSIVLASDELSPSISILRKKTTLTKTVIGNNDVYFSLSDFEKALGVDDLTAITITSLPNIEEGVLKLGSIDVMENQTIPRGSIGYLKLVPKENVKKISFGFSAGGDFSSSKSTCVVNILETINFAPIAQAKSEFYTIKGVSVMGTLSGSDPDGDNISFKIVNFPKKGNVILKDTNTGEIVYTPTSGFKGNDSFTYVISDEYGNTSKEIKATVKVDTNRAGIVYADMTDNAAHTDALLLAADGIITHENIAGVYYFNPTAEVKKSDFIVMLMMASEKVGNLTPVAVTSFADDDLIPSAHKSYIAKAYELGVFEGIEKEDGIYCEPTKTISRAEAAVMISRLLSLESETSLSVFADADSIPEWAVRSVSALYEAGIMEELGENTIKPNDKLDRAQCASMLINVKDHIEKEESISFWDKIFG